MSNAPSSVDHILDALSFSAPGAGARADTSYQPAINAAVGGVSLSPGPSTEQDNPLVRGYNSVKSSTLLSGYLASGDYDAAASNLAEQARYAQANPGSPEAIRLQAAWESGDGIKGGISNVADSIADDYNKADGLVGGVLAVGRNAKAMGSGILAQMPNMAPPVVGMVGGGMAGSTMGPAGTVAGGWAGASAGNTLVGTSESAMRQLKKAGINPEDTVAVKTFLQKHGDAILGDSVTKGAIIGAVDTATAGLSHFILTGPGKAAVSRGLTEMGVDLADGAAVRAATKSPRMMELVSKDPLYIAAKSGGANLARNTAAASLEPLGEYGGELVGDHAVTGEWDHKGAFLEGVSSLGQSAATFAGQKVYAGAKYPFKPDAATATETAAPDAAPPVVDPLIDQLAAANGPLSRATVAANPELKPVDAFTQRANEVESQVRAGGLLNILRQIGQPDRTVAEFMDALQIAKDPRAPAEVRQQAIDSLDMAMGWIADGKMPSDPANGSPYSTELTTQPQPGTELATQQGGPLTDPGNPGFFDPNIVDTTAVRVDNMPPGPRALPAPTPGLDYTAAPQNTAATEAVAPEENKATAGVSQAQAATENVAPVQPAAAAPVATGRTPVSAPKLPTPPGPGVAQLRLRKAQLKAMAADGFDTVERQADGKFVLVNPRRNEAMELTGMGDAQLARKAIADYIEGAAHQAASSPQNDLSLPTEKQIDAENYKKGHLIINGMDVSIENPRWATRSGTGPDGKKWSSVMAHHYGYFKRTEGADGDALDVFIGSRPDSDKVYVIDQRNQDGSFDEHKVMMGFTSEASARAGYLANYEKGWTGLAAITPMTVPQFKAWAKSDAALKPAAGYDVNSTQGNAHDGRGTEAAGNAAARLAGGHLGGSNSQSAAGDQGSEFGQVHGAVPRSDAAREGGPGRDSQDGGGTSQKNGSGLAGHAGAAGQTADTQGVVEHSGRRDGDGAAQHNNDGLAQGREIFARHKDQLEQRLASASSAEEAAILRGEIARLPLLNAPPAAELSAFSALSNAWSNQFGDAAVGYWDTRAGASDGVSAGDLNFINLVNPSMNVLWTIGHEFEHLSERMAVNEGDTAMARLRDYIWSLISDSGRKAYYENYLHAGDKLKLKDATPQQLKHLKQEMLADFMGKRFTDKAWLQNLADTKPALFGAFIKEWLSMLTGLIRSLRGAVGLNQDSPKNVDKYIADLQQAKALATELAISWASKHPKLAEQTGVDEILYSRADPYAEFEFDENDLNNEDLQAEMDAELAAEQAQAQAQVKARLSPPQLEVTDAEIKQAGLMAEEAFPDLSWRADPDARGMQQTVEVEGLHRPGKLDKVSMNLDRSGLWSVDLKGTWVGPAMNESDGYATEAAVKLFAKRQLAAIDLKERAFDLTSTSGKALQKRLVDGWKSVQNASARKFGRPGRTAQSLKDIATDMGLLDRYTITVNHEVLDAHNSVQSVTFKHNGSGMTANALLAQHSAGGKKFLTANTAEMGKGGLGAAFYQMAAEYAARRNMTLRPEPFLSGINSYRRTEQQLSAALRTGKSNVMVPHPVQRVYGFEDDASRIEQHNANLARLILAGVRNARELVPGFDELRYHPASGKFTDTQGKSKDVEVMRMLKDVDARAFGMGRGTLARSVLSHMAMLDEIKLQDALVFAEPVLYSERVAEAASGNTEYAAVVEKYKGTPQWLKAPNGNATKLTERQWVQVRTPSFIGWFGPWEQYTGEGKSVWQDDKKAVSKVVDENGEPMVVYHGTSKGGFYAFNQPGGSKRGDLGIFTTSDPDMARSYARKGSPKDITPPTTQADFEGFGYTFEPGVDGRVVGYTPEGDHLDGYTGEEGEFDTMAQAVQAAALGFTGATDISTLYAAFINLRNPYETDFEGALWSGSRDHQWEVVIGGETQSDSEGKQYFDSKEEAQEFAKTFANPDDGDYVRDEEWGDVDQPPSTDDYVRGAEDHFESTDDVVREGRRHGHDGAIIRRVIDDGGGWSQYNNDPADVFVANKPGQLKSADWNTGEFGDNDDLRYSSKAGGANIVYEVAPDPHDAVVAQAWNQLSPEQRLAASEAVTHVITPKVLKALGASGKQVAQVGSYLEDTNTSFALALDRGDALSVSHALGYVLSQDSMVVLSDQAFEGGDATGAIHIRVGDKTSAEIDAIYQQLRAIKVNGEQPIGGQSTANGVMAVLNFSNINNDELGALIDAKLGGAYDVSGHQIYAAFPQKEDYNYDLPTSHPRGDQSPLRQALDPLRREAASLIRHYLDKHASRGDGSGRPASGGASDSQGAAQQSEIARRDTSQSKGNAAELTPLPGAPNVPGFHGPDPQLVQVAQQYARDNGITLRRQSEYVEIDKDRATRLAQAYADMPHAPNDPVVKEAFANLIRQTTAQYQALVDAGYRFWFVDLDQPSNIEYISTPWNAMRDIRANKAMGVFSTEDGFGSGDAIRDNPLETTVMDFTWPSGGLNGPQKKVLANDLFRAVHDAFAHGLEGAGFRAQGEENAWQAHVRLFTGSAIGAITSETRGQNSWVNYGPHTASNQTAKAEDTVFADQKTGLMPAWTWTDGVVGDAIQHSARTSHFYSELTRQIEQASMKQAPAGAWKSYIKALTQKGVKADEIEWSGVNEWLDIQIGPQTHEVDVAMISSRDSEPKGFAIYPKGAGDDAEASAVFHTRAEAEAALGSGKVSKDALLGYLQANGVQVQEVVLTNEGHAYQVRANSNQGGWEVRDPDGNWWGGYATEAQAKAAGYNDTPENPPKYSQYQLPGGENYREVLLTLPGNSAKRQAAWDEEKAARIAYRAAVKDDAPESEQGALKAKLDKAVADVAASNGNSYKSSHWDQSNVLAHIRVNDRIDSTGAKVLFVEELQSDFGADIRKQQIAIEKAVDDDFQGIIDRMKKAGVLEVNCD